MAFKNKLIWALAGSAVLALGGLALWWWKRRGSSLDVEVSGEGSEPVDAGEASGEPEREFDDWDPAREGLANEVPVPDLSVVKRGAAGEPAADLDDVDPTAPARGSIISRARLVERSDTYVEEAGAKLFPGRVQGAELEAEVGDDVVFVTFDPKMPEGKLRFEALLCRVEGVEGDALEVVVSAAIDKRNLYPPKVDHGYAIGNMLSIARGDVALVLEPERPPTVVAKSRRKRYGVEPGGLIELWPERLPADSSWAASRDDVAVRVVSQDEEHAVVALDGPSGDVNLALMSAGANGTPRPVMSWKFRLLAEAG